MESGRGERERTLKTLLNLIILVTVAMLLFDDKSKRSALDDANARIDAESQDAAKFAPQILLLTSERDQLKRELARLTGNVSNPVTNAVDAQTIPSVGTPTVGSDAPPTLSGFAAPTPHPAIAATRAAIALYPALGQKGSNFNLFFLDLFDQRKKTNPVSLAQPDWPMELAKETAQKLGVAPVTRPNMVASQTPGPTPASNPFMQGYSNPLDKGGYDEKKGPSRYWPWYWYWR